VALGIPGRLGRLCVALAGFVRPWAALGGSGGLWAALGRSVQFCKAPGGSGRLWGGSGQAPGRLLTAVGSSGPFCAGVASHFPFGKLIQVYIYIYIYINIYIYI
jgi:hypothetical protein